MGGNYSTAVNTRSLSITSIPGELLFANSTFKNSTINSAILYYENPTGNVSALLQRTTSRSYPKLFNGGGSHENWVDITSQESKSLPSEFRNYPGMNSSDNQYSKTLYESDTNVTYSAPFTSGANYSTWPVGTLFYSRSNGSQLGELLVSGGSIVFSGYLVGTSGTGNFSEGMNCVSSCIE